MPYVRNSITGTVQKKDNKLYAVINLYDGESQRKRRSISTGFHPRNQKTQANEFPDSFLKVLNEPRYHDITSQFIEVVDGLNQKHLCYDTNDFLNKFKNELEERIKRLPLPNARKGFMDVNMPFST